MSAAEPYAVFAYTNDKQRLRISDWVPYNDAIRSWEQQDAHRDPAVVRFFAVRPACDPDWSTAPVRLGPLGLSEPAEGPVQVERAKRRRTVTPYPKGLVRLHRDAGRYTTEDGHYSIEHQDGITECSHPQCFDLHQKWHHGTGGDWQHTITYVAWHIWDNTLEDYLDHQCVEFDTKREAHQALTEHLKKAEQS